MSRWSPWASLAATLTGVRDKVLEFVTTTYSDPRFIDDIVFEIVSHLDAPDAARAARVCRQWRDHAMHVAYTHVILHSETRTSILLSETLGRSSHLRRHIRHVTIIHCFPALNRRIYMSMFAWMEALPEGSLRTFRAVGDASLPHLLLLFPAVRSCPKMLLIGEAIHHPGSIGVSERHRHTKVYEPTRESSLLGFSSQFFPDWTCVWSPHHTVAINDVAVVLASDEATVRLQQLQDLIVLFTNVSRNATACLVVGDAQMPSEPPVWSSEYIALLETLVAPGCLCVPPKGPLTRNEVGPGNARAGAVMTMGSSLPPSTVQTLLSLMCKRDQPPEWIRLRIVYSRKGIRERGCRDCGIDTHGIVRWSPQA